MTRLEAVQLPYTPKLQPQLPDCSCKVTSGATTYCLGAESCTCYAGAMFVDRVTHGRYQPSGCAIRRMTKDVSGGTTLRQVSDVIRDNWGIDISVYTGSNVAPPSFLARQIRAGRPALVQGNTSAYLGTPYQVTQGDVNHCEEWNAVRGGTLDVPKEVLVLDSCADGRKRAYHVDQGPTWIPWAIGLKFIAYLRPNGEGTARLGPGKAYCAIGPDTEPHVTRLPGSTQAHPFPDRVRAADPNDPTTAIHNRPGGGNATVIRRVKNGTLLRLYQYVEGEEYRGDKTWGANDDGTEFVHFKNITHEMGST